MSFNTSHLLIAAAFGMIGFALGRVTVPMGHQMGPMHGMFMGDSPSGDVQMFIQEIEGGEFEGDTVFAIPGGEVHLVRDGESVEVNVEMTDQVESSENIWVDGDGAVRVVKKVVVVTSDDH
tara:strand:+ start:5131 stop:5493 length:363 start_codon:yes stop_codon:yes gene_type:complete